VIEKLILEEGRLLIRFPYLKLEIIPSNDQWINEFMKDYDNVMDVNTLLVRVCEKYPNKN
jgi:hypothetical protein